jgi:hypothetical protein
MGTTANLSISPMLLYTLLIYASIALLHFCQDMTSYQNYDKIYTSAFSSSNCLNTRLNSSRVI